MVKKLAFLLFGFYFLLFIGCVSAPLVSPPKPGAGIPGIYHKVEKGQTLWRISKAYDVELDEIIEINRISDVSRIETGQLIFIPYRQKPQGSSTNKYSGEDFIWPAKGRVIASFGQTTHNMINKGINIQPYAGLDVVASRSGRVVFCDDNFEGFGKTIIIEHDEGFSTVYARNAEILVRAGQNITKSELIAKIGSAGRDKAVYLHFQIRKGHIAKNPYYYLP